MVHGLDWQTSQGRERWLHAWLPINTSIYWAAEDLAVHSQQEDYTTTSYVSTQIKINGTRWAQPPSVQKTDLLSPLMELPMWGEAKTTILAF